jgi:hypothetical protein
MSDGTVDKNIAEAKVLAGAPAATIKLSNGSTVEIYRCKVKQIGEILEFLKFVFESLGIAKVSDLYRMRGDTEIVASELGAKLDDTELILQLIAKSMDRVFGISSSLSNVALHEFYELELDDALAVCLKVWEVNRDFFLQRILPALKSQFV